MTEEKLTERDYEVLDACCELLSIKIEELKAENDRLSKVLQEIKEYLKGHKIADEVRIKCILDLITKAEEE